MTFTQFTDTQKETLTVIETALAKTRKSMFGTGVSFDMSGLHEGFLGKYNTAASRYIPKPELREEWKTQSLAWCTKPDEDTPMYFAGWVLANRREQKQTANELYSRMTRGHSYRIVSSITEMVRYTDHCAHDRLTTTMVIRLKPLQSSLPKPPRRIRQPSRIPRHQVKLPEGGQGDEGSTRSDLNRTVYTQPHRLIHPSFPFAFSSCDISCTIYCFSAIYVPHQQCYLRRLVITLLVSCYLASKEVLH
jgi:hypothetical protein